ncbi:uncharacterized protein N7477_009200 [Penicillium maclennaniae]|uniref:uncharacterized protein n=1 Tax=Penicillium maclennaniae TaxID=1343394 RepID=UPI0025404948|nr:uncharacterized protein N7477_009200 [Penicillium maclennaniae]KAJ5661584.1 hypothetical protein N7477_009200 [Penicillium maclennaniae]
MSSPVKLRGSRDLCLRSVPSRGAVPYSRTYLLPIVSHEAYLTMRYSYTCAALFAATAFAGATSLRSNEIGMTGGTGAGVLALGNGDVTGVKNAHLSDDHVVVATLVGSDGHVAGVKNAKREGELELEEKGHTVENDNDLIDVGILGNDNGSGNSNGGSGSSIKRDENTQDDFIGPIKVGTPVLDITNL